MFQSILDVNERKLIFALSGGLLRTKAYLTEFNQNLIESMTGGAKILVTAESAPCKPVKQDK